MRWSRQLTGSVTIVALALGVALPAAAQETRAGVVTNLQGSATVSRTAVPQDAPLKFKDEVYVQDRIATAEQSLARLLLGGKATVTVRESSVFKISETPTTSTIEITHGQLALSVNKDRMKRGDVIEIKTPNAITAVRGTVVVAEVTPGTPGGVTSRFTLLTGVVDVSVIDPTTGRPAGTPVTLKPLQRIAVIGSTPPGAPQDISRADADLIAADYRVPPMLPPPGSYGGIVDEQVRAARAAAAAVSAGRLDPPVAREALLPGDEIRSRTNTIVVPTPQAPPPQTAAPSRNPTLETAPTVVATPPPTVAPAPTVAPPTVGKTPPSTPPPLPLPTLSVGPRPTLGVGPAPSPKPQ